MTMSVVTSVSTVGSKKLPPCAALAAGDDLGTLLYGVGDVRLDLLDRLHVDQWPDHRAGLEPVGDLHRTGGLGEPLGEGVVDADPAPECDWHRRRSGRHSYISKRWCP
jgi:hypothetical protein